VSYISPYPLEKALPHNNDTHFQLNLRQNLQLAQISSLDHSAPTSYPLYIGQDALNKAREIAAAIPEFSAFDNAERLKNFIENYASNIIGVYGNIILFSDSETQETDLQQQQLRDVVAALEHGNQFPTGRHILSLAQREGFPLVLKVGSAKNDALYNSFYAAEYGPDKDCPVYEQHEQGYIGCKAVPFFRDMDLIQWAHDSHFEVSTEQGEVIVPAWLSLFHELVHRNQYVNSREISLFNLDPAQMPFGRMSIVRTEDHVDERLNPVSNGVNDIEDDAVLQEGRLAEEADLTPRRTYKIENLTVIPTNNPVDVPVQENLSSTP
jgi:hypothetical protein